MAKGQGATMAEHLLLAWKDAMSFSGPLIMQSEVDVVAQEEWVRGSIFSRLELAAVCGAAAESCHANSLLTAVDATVPVPAVLSVLFFFAWPRSTPPLGSTFLDRCLRPKSECHQDHQVDPYNCLFSVKTPAVKPCSVYIIDLLCSVGSKELSAYRFVAPPYSNCTILLADLVKYRLSAVVSLLCYGDPN